MRPRLFLLAFLLLALGGTLTRLEDSAGVRVQALPLGNSAGETIQATLYLPGVPGRTVPGVLLCHGIDSSKEHLGPLAIAFAQRGFAALTFDFGGHGESYPRPLAESADAADACRALAALAGRPEVDRQRLAVVGFSMGGPAAVRAAQGQAGVRAVVVLGRAAAPDSPPRNLLLGAGLYDQFQSPAELLAALRSASGRAEAVAGSASAPSPTARPGGWSCRPRRTTRWSRSTPA
jgi:dienelactone hydrolase